MKQINSEGQLIAHYIRVIATLAVCLIAVGASSWWYFTNYVDNPDRITNLSSVDHILINNSQRPDHIIELRKKPDSEEWYLEQPFATKASTSRVNTMASFATRLVADVFDSQQIDLDQLGLNPPSIQVSFNDTMFGFGDLDPITGLRYVLKEDKVYLINDNEYSLISGPAYALNENRLARYDAEILALQLGTYRLQRDESAQWYWSLKSEETMPVGKVEYSLADLSHDQERVQTFVDAWNHTYAINSTNGEKLRADQPELLPKARIELEGNQVVVYEIIEHDSEAIFYDAGNSIAYHLNRNNQESLLNLPLAKDDEVKEDEAAIEPVPATQDKNMPTE